jgi:hypothetical protein
VCGRLYNDGKKQHLRVLTLVLEGVQLTLVLEGVQLEVECLKGYGTRKRLGTTGEDKTRKGAQKLMS